MAHRSTRALAAILAFVAPLTAQQTWIVDRAAGPDHDFTSLTAAIAAASSGDTIVMRSGSYVEGVIDVAIGVSIIGTGQVTLELNGGLAPTPGILVHDLGPQESFTIRNVDLGGLFAIPELRADRCDGTVAVHNASGLLGQLGVPEAMSLQFEDCAQVHVQGVFIRDNGVLSFNNSRGTVSSSVLEGDLGSAFALNDSDVTIDSCTITSGFGLFTLSAPLLVNGGTARISRSAVTVNDPNAMISAIDTAGSGTVFLDPTTTLTPGAGFPPVGTSLTVIQGELPTLFVNSGATTLDLSLQASVGQLFVTLLSFQSSVLPLPWGDLWVNADAHIALHVGSLIQRVDSLQLQTVGLPPGLTAVVQTVLFDGDFSLSNGTAVIFP